MAAPGEKRVCPTLPAEQREIEVALAELDERLRTWLTAVTQLSVAGLDPQRLEAAVEAPLPPLPQAAAAPEPAVGATDEDEDTLLARLDPELANAVRVKRRLVGNKRSVRELVAEIEAARETKSKEVGRKSWWRRRDD